MSYNSISTNADGLNLKILEMILSNIQSMNRTENTVEGKSLNLFSGINLFQDMISNNISYEDVSSKGDASLQTFLSFAKTIESLRIANAAKIKATLIQYNQNEDIISKALLSLQGKMKRLKQKEAVLLIDNDAKYLLAEKFENLDMIKESQNSLFIDSLGKSLTLPLKSEKEITINKVVIGSNSNGQSGNSDIDITTNNIRANAIIENNNEWFEYEKMDSGPLKLNLELELKADQIVNAIHIVPIYFGTTMCSVENIHFFSNTKEITSLDMIASRKDLDVNFNNGEGIVIPFVPVKCNKITVKFKQTESYSILTGTVNKTISRERFAIGIKKIRLLQRTYGESGAIESKEYALIDNLFAGIGVVEIFPHNESYSSTLFTKLNNEEWLNIGNINEGSSQDFILDSNNTIQWKLSLQRESSQIIETGNILPVSAGEIVDITRPVNKKISPYEVVLRENIANGNVAVLQINQGGRGVSFPKYVIGYGSGTELMLPLPFDIKKNIKNIDGLHVYVNGIEYEYQLDNEAVSANEWSINENYTDLIFSADTPINAKIEIALDSEIMSFKDTTDAYEHYTDFFFNNAKEKISIKCLPEKSGKASIVLPKTNKNISLGFQYLVPDSFKVSSKNNIPYTEVYDRASLNTPNKYMVDYKNGLVWLSSTLDSDTVRVSFEHHTPKILDNKDYEIIYSKELYPIGFRIAHDSLSCANYKETVSGNLLDTLDVVTGMSGVRNIPSNMGAKAKVFSHTNIIRGTVKVSEDLLGTDLFPEEIDFIDGISEFYGLLPIENEFTNEIVASEDIVSFSLAAGTQIYSALGIHFSDTDTFNNEQNALLNVIAPGDYYIGSNGVVYVFIGTGNSLPGDIAISYMYKDPYFDATNKYSVDYSNGILYAYKNLNSEGTIEYKTANYICDYEIANVLQNIKTSIKEKKVSIRTEELNRFSSDIKIIWYTTNSNESVTDLIPYYSPIITLLGFRFQ